MTETPTILRTRGDAIVDADGASVVLRGVGLGGWMNMENFITGYPATESRMRAAVAAAVGPQRAQRFFDRLLGRFFEREDAQLLAGLGVNCVRVPVNYLGRCVVRTRLCELIASRTETVAGQA